MRGYAIRRFLLLIPTLVILTVLVFFFVRFIPGDVIDVMAGQLEQQGGLESGLGRDKLENALGLDVPVHVQYGRWVWGIITRGDLGTSLWQQRSLLEIIRPKLPVTIELSLLSMVLGLLFAVPIGIYAAIRQDTVVDYIMRTVSIMALAIPAFWLAVLVFIYPARWWNWTPPIEYIPLVENPLGNLAQFLLPAFIMGLSSSGSTMRITRTMMLEVMRQDYIRTAWAKGLKERIVVVRHAVKNTLIPVITIVGGMIPGLLGGSVIMEQIFCLPGMGRYLLEAVTNRDYNIVSGYNLLMATLVMLIILVTDLSYAYVDPRIRYR
jgi:peptide/nickel transport system permease protein